MFSNNFKQKLPDIFIHSLIIVLAIAIISLIAGLSFSRYLVSDEFEHLHAAWLVSQGQIPYKDFFEHHTPLLWYLLAPIFLLFKSPILIVSSARLLILSFVALVFFLVYKITAEMFSKWSGIFAIFTLSTTFLYIQNTIEIRPDTPMIFFWLVSWFYFLKATKNDSLKYYIYTGLFLSVAFLFKQVIILALLAYLIILFFEKRKFILKNSISLIASFLFIQLIVLAIFYFLGGLNQYLNLNFWWNLKINNYYHFPIFNGLKRYLYYDWFLYLLGIMGLSIVIKKWIKEKIIKTSELLAVIFLIILALFLILLTNAPYTHYWPPILIILSMFAGNLFNHLIFVLKNRLIFKMVVIYFIFFILNNFFLGSFYTGLFNNKQQIKRIDLILEITKNNDRVFSSNGEYVPMRPHASYYWFLTDNMMAARQKNKIDINFVEYIENSDVIIWNKNIPELKNIFLNNLINEFEQYQNTDIYLRKE